MLFPRLFLQHYTIRYLLLKLYRIPLTFFFIPMHKSDFTLIQNYTLAVGADCTRSHVAFVVIFVCLWTFDVLPPLLQLYSLNLPFRHFSRPLCIAAQYLPSPHNLHCSRSLISLPHRSSILVHIEILYPLCIGPKNHYRLVFHYFGRLKFSYKGL